MDNFEAITQMDRAQLSAFLDSVYLTGLNNGMYAANLDDDSQEKDDLLDKSSSGLPMMRKSPQPRCLMRMAICS